MKLVRLSISILISIFTVSACGVRGPLVPPEKPMPMFDIEGATADQKIKKDESEDVKKNENK